MEEKTLAAQVESLRVTLRGWRQRKAGRQVGVFFLLTPFHKTPFHKTKPCS